MQPMPTLQAMQTLGCSQVNSTSLGLSMYILRYSDANCWQPVCCLFLWASRPSVVPEGVWTSMPVACLIFKCPETFACAEVFASCFRSVWNEEHNTEVTHSTPFADGVSPLPCWPGSQSLRATDATGSDDRGVTTSCLYTLISRNRNQGMATITSALARTCVCRDVSWLC
jgi:hypothetical protein